MENEKPRTEGSFEEGFRQAVAGTGKITGAEKPGRKLSVGMWVLIGVAVLMVGVLITGLIIQTNREESEVLFDWPEEDEEVEALVGEWECDEGVAIRFYRDGGIAWSQGGIDTESVYTTREGTIQFDGWEGVRLGNTIVAGYDDGRSMRCDKLGVDA